MFPSLNNDPVLNDSIEFFGLQEVPEYEEKIISGCDDLNKLAESIRLIKEDCCGYIEPIKVYYYTMDEKQYFLDFNREFVFVYFKDENYDHLPLGFIMKFLQYQSKKILLVFEDNYFFFEKTDATYKVCADLDKIYGSPDFFYENIIKKVPSKTILGDCLINLINIYKSVISKSDFKETDEFDMLTRIMKLNIE